MNDKKLINDLFEIINNMQNKNISEKELYFNENITYFEQFKLFNSSIIKEYLFKDSNYKEINELSNKLNYIIKNLLQLDLLYQKHEHLIYYITSIVESLKNAEEYYAFLISRDDDLEKSKNLLEYLSTHRIDYLNILLNIKLDINDDFNKDNVDSYVNCDVYKNFLGHLLMNVNNNFTKLEKDEVVEFLQNMDDVFFTNVELDVSVNKDSFFEHNLLYQYCRVWLKLKAIFLEDKLKDDVCLLGLVNYEIKDKTIIDTIIDSVDIDNIFEVIEEKDNISEYINLYNSLKKQNAPEEFISNFIRKILQKDENLYNIVNLLLSIDLPKNYNEFINSKYAIEYEFLSNKSIYDELEKKEEIIKKGNRAYLAADYYVKTFERVSDVGEIEKYFIDNAEKVVETNFYSQEDKIRIINAINSNEIINQIKNDPKKDDDNPYKGTIENLIKKFLIRYNIDIGNRIYWGRKTDCNGYFSSYFKSIWLGELSKDDIIENQTAFYDLIETAIHEMQHYIQQETYDNIIIKKEEILRSYDKDYYCNNYKYIFDEVDAREKSERRIYNYVKDVEFTNKSEEEIKELNKYLKKIKEKYLSDNSILKNEDLINNKKIGIGENNYIKIDDYIELLLEFYPTIAEKCNLESNAIVENSERKK